MNKTKRIAVLVSGSGTNLQAIIDAVQAGRITAEIALVLSNRPDVKALERAQRADIPTVCLPHNDFPSREAYDEKLISVLQEAEIDIVALAGFDRILSNQFVRTFHHRLLNIHPALLPAFPGLHAVKQALDYGARYTGVTVHFVDEGVDTGPIILQEAIEIHPDDTEESLLERVHTIEHRLYVKAIQLLVEDRIEIDGRRVRIL